MKPIFLSFLLFCSGSLFAQFLSSPNTKVGVLQGNNITTVFTNESVIAEPCFDGPRFAWIDTTNGYIGDMSIMIGVELPIKDYNGDNIPDTVHAVISCPVSRPAVTQSQDPITGKWWTFEPLAGYSDSLSTTPAISTLPHTWPPFWPDHPEYGSGVWNGLAGAGKFSGDQETYFVMDDQNFERFNYASNNPAGIAFKPDSSDTTINGLGIRVSVRYIESANPLFKDVFFRVFDITNASDYNYSKVVFGNLTGTYIGITGCDDSPMEYDNDVSFLDSVNNVIFAYNYPPYTSRDPEWVGTVGRFVESFLQTPNGNKIGSYKDFAPAVSISLGNDDSLWASFMPGRYVAFPGSLSGADEDYMYGSNYFSLNSGQTQRIASVVALGYSDDQVRMKVFQAQALWNSGMSIDSALKVVRLKSFSGQGVLTGTIPIQWTSQRSGGTVDIWYSPDVGDTWQNVVRNAPNIGSYSWNSAQFTSSEFGNLELFIKDSSGNIYGFSQDSSYFILRSGIYGIPTVRILDTIFAPGSQLNQRSFDLHLLVGNPWADSVNVGLYYRVTGNGALASISNYTIPSNPNPQVFTLNMLDLPNSQHFQFLVQASSSAGSTADSTHEFIKNTPRATLSTSNVQKISGFTQVPMTVRIADSSKVKPDIYIITFDDTTTRGQKSINVYDSTLRATVLYESPLLPNIETALFDGMTLYAEDIPTALSSSSHWSPALPIPPSFSASPLSNAMSINGIPVYGYPQPNDYRIVFHSNPIDSSTGVDSLGTPSIPVPYEVYNMQTNRRVKLVAFGGSVTLPPSMVLMESVGATVKYTWIIQFPFTAQATVPGDGDTLYFITQKGISFYDSLRVEGIVTSVTSRKTLPKSFKLYQNYPNPFNPTTTILYTLPEATHVTLEVFDILGRKVVTLVNGVQTAGFKSVIFDAGNLASGIYIYRILAGGHNEAKKLVVLK